MLIHDLLAAGLALGGAISGEHGIGRGKKTYVATLEDPAKLGPVASHQDGLRSGQHPQPGAIFDP